MIDDVLKIGDKVVITIPKENREAGYNPYPDSTVAKVVGFNEIYWGRINNCGYKPGVHMNKSWPIIEVNGKPYTESSCRLELVDKQEYERRVKEWDERGGPSYIDEKLFLRDLPETAFWEGDRTFVWDRSPLNVVNVPDVESVGMLDASLKSKRLSQERELMVIDIMYHWKREDEPWTYEVSDGFSSAWYTYAREADMELIERGNVWKYFHGQKPQFKDILEEVNFFKMLGHYKEVRNPSNGYYRWTMGEVLPAIKEGIVDGFAIGPIPFSSKQTIDAIKMNDEDLGRRLREATIEHFGMGLNS